MNQHDGNGIQPKRKDTTRRTASVSRPVVPTTPSGTAIVVPECLFFHLLEKQRAKLPFFK